MAKGLERIVGVATGLRQLKKNGLMDEWIVG
jgi:hypothetical protein